MIIGHRGASAYAPENTLAAFEKALSLGCRYLEFDVMLSADGEPFVFHDEQLQRTTNGRGAFGQMEAMYLRTLDAGKWFAKGFQGEKIPSFKDVLQWLALNQVKANIEIKPFPGTTEKTTVAVLQHINQFFPHTEELPLVSSFDWKALTLCRAIAPEMPLGLLLDEWDKDWLAKANALQCYSLHFNRRALTAARVQEIKAEGFHLYVYTVNRKRQAQRLLGWGVDALFSDYPDLLTRPSKWKRLFSG
ncbi:MAG: glycerophosphodiester phosphodiesterase [Tatlockia sp.]|jgi:glycerophosphoryl diester phosphodiesterase